jgi:putative Holliday junction resolvase
MDGSEGPRSLARHARNLADLDLPILMWDERWSTTSAERGLIEQDMSRAKRKERIDLGGRGGDPAGGDRCFGRRDAVVG